MKINNKLIASIVGITIILVALSIISFGDDPIECVVDGTVPSAKTAAVGYNTEIVPPQTPILIANAHIKAQDELIITFSSEAILFTQTKVSRVNQSATAASTLRVWAVVDDRLAYPYEGITFAERIQKLDVEYSDLYTNDTINSIQLALDTTNANSFSFIAYDIGKNEDHSVEIWASVETHLDGGDENNEAHGSFGKRTLIVEDVNLKGINYPCTEGYLDISPDWDSEDPYTP